MRCDAGKLLLTPNFAESLNSFSNDLMKQQKYKEDNIIYSPLGIAMVVGMCLTEAKGESRNELFKLLHMNEFIDRNIQVHQKFREFREALALKRQSTNNATVEYANLVLSSNGLQLPETFENKLKAFYAASLGKEDFAKNGEQVKNKINNFVKERTYEQIPQLLSAPLSSTTVMALINTIYFKGYWEYKMGTHENYPFYNSDNSESKITMLSSSPKDLKFYNSQKLNAKILELPYKGNVSMILLLPIERYGLKDSLESWTNEDLKVEISKLEKKLVRVKMPQYEFDHTIDLTQVLPNMGVNLKGVLKGVNPLLEVDQAIHKAKIRTDKEGTVASAVTIFSAVPFSAIIYKIPPIDFIADHPFAFIIRDMNSGVNLFAGIVNKIK